MAESQLMSRKMSAFLHQRPLYPLSPESHDLFPRSRQDHHKTSAVAFLSRGPASVLLLLSLLIIVGVVFPHVRSPDSLIFFTSRSSDSKWRSYTLSDAAAYAAKNKSLVVCAVSEAYLSFLNNWLISIARQKHHDQVLVIAEDYATLFKVNERWPGHAVLVPPALEAAAAHKFGSQGFFNFTARRPQHLLQILELGYNVMYNDVDMVWLADPFPYFEGEHDVYFMDDMAYDTLIKKPNLISSMFLIIQLLACYLTSYLQVDVYLLPQKTFPTGGLYFRNKTWARETEGMHVIIHNNYIIGFEKMTKRFRDYGLWLVDKYAAESLLGRLE
ncbi:hypothetical protein SASPL_134880 [Salvia splendens]|uniref:Nucleotide-diphospho-sugar transferase domain-containing protein n=1 Tax=Salvia splendens TaxID=180675 RepID=A0A8X8WZ23_SALSN|nr:hypothetical protein SASPL_134880 [Salvia splendens]